MKVRRSVLQSALTSRTASVWCLCSIGLVLETAMILSNEVFLKMNSLLLYDSYYTVGVLPKNLSLCQIHSWYIATRVDEPLSQVLNI